MTERVATVSLRRFSTAPKLEFIVLTLLMAASVAVMSAPAAAATPLRPACRAVGEGGDGGVEAVVPRSACRRAHSSERSRRPPESVGGVRADLERGAWTPAPGCDNGRVAERGRVPEVCCAVADSGCRREGDGDAQAGEVEDLTRPCGPGASRRSFATWFHRRAHSVRVSVPRPPAVLRVYVSPGWRATLMTSSWSRPWCSVPASTPMTEVYVASRGPCQIARTAATEAVR